MAKVGSPIELRISVKEESYSFVLSIELRSEMMSCLYLNYPLRRGVKAENRQSRYRGKQLDTKKNRSFTQTPSEWERKEKLPLDVHLKEKQIEFFSINFRDVTIASTI